MGLDDFNKIQQDVDVETKKKIKGVEDIDIEKLDYYLHNLDELIDIVKKSYLEYVNLKLKYDFKKNDYQVNINWNEENNLRVANGLPKVTNQDQRNAIIDLKLKPLNEKLKSYEFEYKFYNKIFTFINNNFELLCKLYDVDSKSDVKDDLTPIMSVDELE